MPALLGAGLLATLLFHLASPAVCLATRDVPLFHLPLRVAFRNLVRECGAFPHWNPLLNGGQPLLSNPNYAAFYPPTWLGLILPPTFAINLLVLLHAALAFLGAWRFARQLGCEPPAAGLTASAFAAGGFFISLTAMFNFFCGIAWLPWILAWGEGALGLASPRWRRSAVLCAGGLALQLLAGEPVAVLISGLSLACLAASQRRGSLVAWGRLAVLALLGAALSAIQLLPTWQRLGDSPRADRLSLEEATEWSAPPARFVEFVFPHFFGDPVRDEENLYFGWGIHDKDYPYVLSIYPGLLFAVLGLSALLCWPIPHRLAWSLAALVGLLLAMGRHNPLYGALSHLVPGLPLVRYPEKFIVLCSASLTFAGGLGWQHLSSERRRGRHRCADFPLALSIIVLALATLAASVLVLRPEVARWFMEAHSGLPPSPSTLDSGLAYLRREAAFAVVLVSALLLLLALWRRRTVSEVWLVALGALLLNVDLGYYNHGFNAVLSAEHFRTPPPLAAEVLARPGRLFTNVALDSRPEISLRHGEPGFFQMLGRLERLDPYSATLWGIPYALHEDYDLMLTSWARHALEVLHHDWPNPWLAARLTGAWNVSHVLIRRPPEEMLDEYRRTRQRPQLAELLDNSHALPRFRFPTRVTFHCDLEAALAAARSNGYDLAAADHCVVGGAPSCQGRTIVYGRPVVLNLLQRGGRVDLRYRTDSPAFLVAAMTYDDDWRASIDEAPAATCPTAIGQIGVALPKGEHSVHLEYRDPWIGVGGAFSLVALLAAILAWRRLG